MSHPTTLAPSTAKSMALARHIPDPAPFAIATFSSNLICPPPSRVTSETSRAGRHFIVCFAIL